MNDKLKEQIKFETELLKLVAVVLLTDLGGVVGLIVSGKPSAGKNLMISLGIMIATVCIRFVYLRYKGVKRLIDGL